MRKMKRPPAEELRKKKEEPLAEGLQIVVPTSPSGRRLWRKMSDRQIIEFAEKVMKEEGITGRKELRNIDSGLYTILSKRNLLDKIGFEKKQEKRSPWNDMSDTEIIEFAMRIMEEKGITRKQELKNENSILHGILYKRGLLDEVGFEDNVRSWKDVGDGEIIEHVRKVMREKGISGRYEMQKADHGLYGTLKTRGLLDKVGFEDKVRKKRAWKSMIDEEVLILARKLKEEMNITRRKKFENADSGLYRALKKRRLIDEVGFEDKQRSWKHMSDEEIIDIARKLVEEKKISGKGGIRKADSGLYNILRKRGLFAKVGFEDEYRSWESMDDEEVIEIARKVMEEKGISWRSELRKADQGAYNVLRKRGLLGRAFAHIEQQKTDSARDAVIDALEAFAANDNNSAEDDVA